jgi:hypothetical protein
VRCAFSRLDYGSLALRPVASFALLSELTRLAPSQRGRLHPGFRRFGHPPRRRISLQCQLGNLHWRDFHSLDHQFSFTALSRRTKIVYCTQNPCPWALTVPRRPVGVKGILVSFCLDKVFLPPSTHCHHASIRTLEERIVSLGAGWAFSFQPVPPSDWRPVVS